MTPQYLVMPSSDQSFKAFFLAKNKKDKNFNNAIVNSVSKPAKASDGGAKVKPVGLAANVNDDSGPPTPMQSSAQ